MQINLGSGDSLTAVQAGAVTTTAPTSKVDFVDGASQQTAMKALAGVTAVTLLSGQSNGTRTVTGLSVLNGDTVTQTVTVSHIQGGVTFPIVIMTLLAGETLVIGSNGVNVLDSSGNIKLAFASSATTFTGDVTLSGGKDLIFSGTTGQSLIQFPDNLASALVIGEGANSYFTFVTTDSSELIKCDKSQTVATGKTLAVVDADKLTVGSVIVPQDEIITLSIPLHATKVTYNLFVARTALQVLAIDYTPDIAQGGALTATVVKATGTTIPASATTPMHIAGAIDLNAAAHTVQSISLTGTGADLQLAAGNRIGLVLSGAMTVGSGNVTIRMKRI